MAQLEQEKKNTKKRRYKMHSCKTLKDFKDYYRSNQVDHQDFLAEASKVLDEEDLGLLESFVGD